MQERRRPISRMASAKRATMSLTTMSADVFMGARVAQVRFTRKIGRGRRTLDRGWRVYACVRSSHARDVHVRDEFLTAPERVS
jgi:hypothetical protein